MLMLMLIKTKTVRALSLAPWFPSHLQRDIYFSLLHLEQPSAKENKTTPVPETVLKAALLRRAAEDIKRVSAIQSQKQALALLLQRGSVGDDLWQRFLRAEKEMEEEVRDVLQEVSFFFSDPPPPRIFYLLVLHLSRRMEMKVNIGILHRQMHTFQIGVKSYSNPREKWSRTIYSVKESRNTSPKRAMK